MLGEQINKQVQEWIGPKFDSSVSDEINQLLIANNESELHERFYKELNFGTGGVRAIMGSGTSRMNVYTVGRIAQGLAIYLKKQHHNSKQRVVIGYDGRKNSRDFALRFVQVLTANDICCLLFRSFQVTPILSYAVMYLKADAGIMITASHNPAEYNGVKVYNSYGGQLLPQEDAQIMKEVKSLHLIDDVHRISLEEAKLHKLVEWIEPDLVENYYRSVEESIVPYRTKLLLDRREVHIVYTALHGTGGQFAIEILKRGGFLSCLPVQEQFEPDAEFSTVCYPNPEDPLALELALDLAKRYESDAILANDPDADRLGVMIRCSDEVYRFLSGNEIGIIFVSYLLDRLNENAPNDLQNAFIVRSLVSSSLVDRIADDFGILVKEVYPGFKYISNQMQMSQEKKFLFGFEESLGYNYHRFLHEKDGLSAALLMSEIICWCKNQNQTVIEYLDAIYKNYGFELSEVESLPFNGVEGTNEMAGIMQLFRTSPPQVIAKNKVVQIRDFLSCEDRFYLLNETMETHPIKDCRPQDILTFYLDNKSRVIVRPSGTEPKIKIYFQVYLPIQNSSIDEVKREAEKNLEKIKKSIRRFLSLKT